MLEKLKHCLQHHYVWLLPCLMLLVGLPFSYVVWNSEKDAVEFDQQLRFEYKVKEVRDLILYRLDLYEQVLYGLQSFYRASDFVSEEEFKLYASAVLNSGKYPGVQVLGFVKYMDARAPITFKPYVNNIVEFAKHHYGSAEFTEIAPKVYVIPSNSAELYANQFAVPDLKAQLLESAESNVVGMYALFNEDQRAKDALMILHLPIYVNGRSDDGASASNSQIDGWVTATLDVREFFDALLAPISKQAIVYRIYNGTMVDDDELIYDSLKHAQGFEHQSSRFEKHMALKVLGQDWVLAVHAADAFNTSASDSQANVIGILSVLASLSVAGIIYFMAERLRTLAQMQNVNQRLTLSEQRWQFAVEGSGDGLWDWDLQTNQVMFSRRWKALLGYEEHEIGGHPDEWRLRIHPEDYVEVMSALEATLNNQADSYSMEFRLKCKDDSWKWILARGMVLSRDADNKALRMVVAQTDISNIKESEEAVWQHANFDLLTGLPNRRNFYTQLDQALKKAKRSGLKVALFFLDLDKFKEVNDTQGHDQGDYLLRLTANRLKECMRSTDAVFRLGGDEFVILIGDLTDAELDNLDIVGHKVLAELAKPYYLAYEVAYISASIGIAVYPNDAGNTDDLMKCVDQAMYAAKQKGGNSLTYFLPHMQQVAQHRMQLSNDLRLALQRAELFIEYQPIVNLSTMQVCKAEALLRWQYPTRGLVSPAEFIPIAEDTRLIQDIGHWVFLQAIEQARDWRKKFSEAFQISVNKSPMQFMSEEVRTQDWLDVLKQKHLPGDLIVVEITERLILDGSVHVKNRLRKLHTMGVQVALDDFGTGYSSLSYLKKFDIDYLKIDRSFVANLSEGSSDLALCRAMIVMAHTLGMQVVAEGIETQLQMDLLVAAGCDFGQGYYFAKSLSPSQFELYMAENLTPVKP